MAEFSLDRFKYNWKGNWTAGTDYIRDDIVRVNGKSYVCIVGHTASASFRTDQNAIVPGSSPPIPQPRWVVMTSSRSFIGDWQTSTDYNIGDIIQFQGSLYVCQIAHASTDFHTDAEGVDKTISESDQKWILFAAGQFFNNDWSSNTSYGLNNIVKYGGILYKSIKVHLSSSNFENDTENWQQFYVGFDYKNNWLSGTLYKPNDLVRYGASIFLCIETHTSAADELDDTKFIIYFPGSQYDGDWSSTTVYNQGDIVKYGGVLYQAINNNRDSNPSKVQVSDTDDSTIDWIILAKGYNFRGDWQGFGFGYKTGDIVQRGGRLYVAVRDVGISDGDGSTLDYLDPEVWETLIPGQVFSAAWQENETYSVGEVVTYYGSTYVCNEEHVARDNNFPGDNGSGYAYWSLLVQAGSPGGMLYFGDLLTYGLSRDQVGDGSTLGDIRVPIGNTKQVLSVSDELEVFWRNIGSDSDVIYVGKHGVDAEGYGLSKNIPFRTVRYACQYVEDNFPPLTPTKISVATGRFEEVGPISIPAGCAVVGDELRSTTIVASKAKTAYNLAYINYHYAAIDYITTVIFDVLNGIPITPQNGNTTQQNTVTAPTSLDAINALVANFTDYKDYINFRVSSGSTDPEVSGVNTLHINPFKVNAGNNLELNKNFLANEGYHWLVNNYPDITFDEVQVKQDLLYLFRGLKRDIQYAGNYLTLVAARYIANSNTGSTLDDLFWVRDTTGLRQCTIDGLQGTLNPPGVFAQYQRPTGGACVALDPGWGPDDNRTWIVNRSPYIQGVTNIGTACVGKKIDGSLHNGGNRSMVSNDFTQVLSDGIGAWVTNNARAELVSVFTYYCQVGYLAENGGVIRATNGNNSYGTYGSIAEGNDPNEVPQDVTVNNRENEAIVHSAFAGGNSDQIFAFEYDNAGQNYTTVAAEIVGAGADASVSYREFRDGALFQSRLINTSGSGSEGGSGYTVRQSSAQVTIPGDSQIILNTNEQTQFESEILNMRILIVQGTGVGQYGYVAAYDTVSKVCTVRKESTNELGWDHVLPGFPIEANLDSTTTYRIEPRIYANHPGFTSTYSALPQSRTFVDSNFGDLTGFHFNITLANGSAGVQDAVEVAAVVNVIRNGENYVVNITNPGAGYAVGDELTIAGTSLGGASPANDLIITVTENSNDSTNSIESISTSGTGRSGRYVALAEPNFVVYSDDGASWTEANLSDVLNYNRLIVGRNRFIALATNTASYSFSYDAVTWFSRTLPSSANWIDGAHGILSDGSDRFVVIAENSNNAAYGSDGLNWTASTLPTGDDSSGDQWQAIAFGQQRFIAITGSQTKDVAYTTDGTTWARYDNVLPAGEYTWIKLEYGNNRFLAFSDKGDVAYSLDRGASWQLGTAAPSIDGSTIMAWKDIKYNQGVFVAVCDTGGTAVSPVEYGDPYGNQTGPTDYIVTTEDGITWQERNLAYSRKWSTIMSSSLGNEPTWIALSDSSTNQGAAIIKTGCQAKVRADVTAGSFNRIKIWEPGSGYSVSNPVTLTVIDNNFSSDVELENRIANNVLPQPDFINRGTGYKTSTSTITLIGDGFADIVEQSSIVTLDGVSATIPGPGVQIRFITIDDENSDDPAVYKLFTGVGATDLGDDGSGNGTRTVRFTISPALKNEYNLAHGTQATLRTGYSQCRISGHDFLDIGTGNFAETNYPELYAGGAFFQAAPENEVLEVEGGRVFYVSTDQDGNFRTGELFGVDQATGIVTISAEFFDLDGLSELSLGGVRLGGSGAVVSEFSTDPTFSADSNNIIPTQKAIATFLADRLSVGGSDLETNAITAGQVQIGTSENVITMTGGNYLNIRTEVNFDGQDALGNPTAIQGTIISQMLFSRNFNDTVQ